jgi:hypothetical protein
VYNNIKDIPVQKETHDRIWLQLQVYHCLVRSFFSITFWKSGTKFGQNWEDFTDHCLLSLFPSKTLYRQMAKSLSMLGTMKMLHNPQSTIPWSLMGKFVEQW